MDDKGGENEKEKFSKELNDFLERVADHLIENKKVPDVKLLVKEILKDFTVKHGDFAKQLADNGDMVTYNTRVLNIEKGLLLRSADELIVKNKVFDRSTFIDSYRCLWYTKDNSAYCSKDKPDGPCHPLFCNDHLNILISNLLKKKSFCHCSDYNDKNLKSTISTRTENCYKCGGMTLRRKGTKNNQKGQPSTSVTSSGDAKTDDLEAVLAIVGDVSEEDLFRFLHDNFPSPEVSGDNSEYKTVDLFHETSMRMNNSVCGGDNDCRCTFTKQDLIFDGIRPPPSNKKRKRTRGSEKKTTIMGKLVETYLMYGLPDDPDYWKVVKESVSRNGLALEHTNELCKQDFGVVSLAVGNNGLALQFAAEELKKDIDIIEAAVEENPLAIAFVSGTWKCNKELALKVLSKPVNSSADCPIRYLCESLRADEEVVKTSVIQNVFSLQYAQMEWNDDLVKLAVTKNGQILENSFFSSKWRCSREMILAGVITYPRAFLCAENEWKVDYDFTLQAVTANGLVLEHIDVCFNYEEDKLKSLIKAAAKQNAESYKFAASRMDNIDTDFIKELTDINPLVREFIPESLTSDPDLVQHFEKLKI